LQEQLLGTVRSRRAGGGTTIHHKPSSDYFVVIIRKGRRPLRQWHIRRRSPTSFMEWNLKLNSWLGSVEKNSVAIADEHGGQLIPQIGFKQ
jgi:hypothetical protein